MDNLRLFEIENDDSYFALEYKSGSFEVIYRSCGIECRFECDTSAENVFYFYMSLDTAYDIEFARNSKAVLSGMDADNTQLTFQFDDKCRCKVSGHIRNKSARYRNGFEFEMDIEQSDVCSVLISLDKFLKEYKQIHGNIL